MNKERLLKIAEHLESGKLAHEEFDFNVINSNKEVYPNGERSKPVGNVCGTSGCALGEFPAIFPEHFEWWDNHIRSKTNPDSLLNQDVRLFLDISSSAVNHLFYPSQQLPFLYSGEMLNKHATKEQVAANIRAFIEKD